MASPVRDGLATVNNWAGTLTKTVTLTTSLTNDVICVQVAITGLGGTSVTPSAITGITSTSGLVFTRSYRALGIGAGGGGVAEELWSAPSAAALTAEVITITLNILPDACCVAAFGIHGLNSIAAPFDNNASLPVTGGAITLPPPTLTYSTTQANDLILYAHAHINSNPGIEPTGWTLIANLLNLSGSGYSSMIVASLSVSAAQTGATVTAPGGTTSSYAAGLTAFTADASASPAGVKSYVSIIW